jgi:hypothetical protein
MIRNLSRRWVETGALPALMVLTLLPACSGSDKDEPRGKDTQAGEKCGAETPEDACPKEGERPALPALIDDLEDGDAQIFGANGRSGSWWAAGDETASATMVPPRDNLAPPEAISGGRCDSKRAVRITGQGFLDWGALLGVDLIYGARSDGSDGNLPYDASAYSGIEFWARIGDTSTDRVRFAVSDVNNEPYGGVCTDNNQSNEQCYDTFGTYLNGLSPEWRHYRVPFTSLTQRQFGYPASAAATDALFSVQFNFDPSSIFDFWVDDLAFY